MLTDANRLEFQAVTKEGWFRLLTACQSPVDLKGRDIIILRLYFAMLGHLEIVGLKDDSSFIGSVAGYLRAQPDLNKAVDAEQKFSFTEETRHTVK